MDRAKFAQAVHDMSLASMLRLRGRIVDEIARLKKQELSTEIQTAINKNREMRDIVDAEISTGL